MIAALFFSAFIWLESFGIENKLIYSIFALAGFALVLKLPIGSGFWFGFFVGLFWFWGVSLSFIYYDLAFLIPVVILGFGFAYGVFFYLLDLYESPFFKAFFLFFISYFEPFGFNWLKPELLLVNSFFEIEKIYLLLILLIIAFFITYKKYFVFIAMILAINFGIKNHENINLKISMPIYATPQNIRWNETNKHDSLVENFKNIDSAIKEKQNLIILPETAFSLILNHEPQVLETLIQKSYKISIITGGLFYDGKNMFNSTYFFADGKYKIAHKTVLVPFGEAVPFPALIRDIINGVFFDGAEDYQVAASPTDFEIDKYKFRNAICYEATTDTIFEGSPKYMIATSNIGWFVPSTIPNLQNLLLKLYAKKYQTTIFHSVNMGENRIFRP